MNNYARAKVLILKNEDRIYVKEAYMVSTQEFQGLEVTDNSNAIFWIPYSSILYAKF